MLTAPRLTTSLFAPMFLLLAISPNARAAEPTDEFDNGETLKSWSVLRAGPRQSFTQALDIDRTRKGWLTISPRPGHAWYNEGMAPLLYQLVEGDFLVETHVNTRSQRMANSPPQAHYNSGGLMVRDPASAPGRQNWLVVNVGRQDPHTGTEVKTTVNSVSRLELQRGSHDGKLRLARIGTMIYTLRQLDDEREWTLIRQFDRRDLPRRVQVGLMCNGWTDGADLVAEFDYIRYRVPKAVADLTAPIDE